MRVRLLIALALLPWLALSGDADPPAGPRDTPATKPVRFTLQSPDENLRALAFSPDGKALAALTWTRLVLWDIQSGREVSHPLDLESKYQLNLAWSPDGKRLATVHQNGQGCGTILLWEITNSNQLRKLREIETPWLGLWCRAWRVTFAPDGQTLLAGTRQGTVLLWDIETGKQKLHFHGGVAATFAPDGQSMVSVGQGGAVHRWKIGTNQLLEPDNRDRTEFIWATQVAFDSRCRQVAVSDDHSIWLKDVATGRTTRRLELPVTNYRLDFAPDGKLLAVVREGGIALLDTATGQERGWLEKRGVMGFAPDGATLALWDGKAVQLEDITTVLSAGKKGPGPANDPPEAALKAELIARRDTYVLDIGGLKPAEFIEEMPHQGFDEPQVDLLLKFTNTGKQPIKIDPRFGLRPPTLHLIGPGALNLPDEPRQTGLETDGGNEPAKPLELAAGASHTLPITRLLGDDSVFWIVPGEYRVHATWGTSVSPAPKGSRLGEEGYGSVWVRCAPITLKVLAPKGPSADPLEKSGAVLPLGALVPPPEEEKTSILRKKLDTKVTLDKGLQAGTKLKDALDFLSDRYDADFVIDKPAFKKAGKEDISATRVELRKVAGVSLKVVLYMVLDQLEATFELRDGAVRIVPDDKPASLAERLRPPQRWHRKPLRAKLSAPVTVKQFPDDTTLSEAIEFFEDRYDLTILIDRQAFVLAKIQDIEKQTVKLAAQDKVPLGKALAELLKPARATFLLREDFILIVPAADR
jgi:hypothetical protein